VTAGGPRLLAALLLPVLLGLAWLRPVDHDESQYVAAAVLTARGLVAYRDFAWLQTPLQPWALAPVAWVAGDWTWPALRLVNAGLAWVAVVAVAAAARAGGASRSAAAWAAGLFAGCDVLLFAAGTARNDTLPAAALAVALWLAMGEATRRRAVTIGALLATAAAAKISYALSAAAYGGLALIGGRRAGWVALGASAPAALVVGSWLLAPDAFAFGVLHFPAAAPAEWFADQPNKLSAAGKAADLCKFLALGAALPALAVVVREQSVRRSAGGAARKAATLATTLLIAGLVAAVLPSPVWRQYLLPALPPLFVLLALRWTAVPPGRAERIAFAVFAVAGLAPSVAALAKDAGMPTAIREGRALRAAFGRAGVAGPVATLAPQLLSLAGRVPEPRFATGPFVFRTRAIVPAGAEARWRVVPAPRLPALFAADPPAAIVTGVEGWTAGDPALDRVLDRWAATHGYRAMAAGRSTLWVRAITAR